MKFSIWLENTEEAGFEQDICDDANPPSHKFLIYADWLEDNSRSREANFIRNVVSAMDELKKNNVKSAILHLFEAKKQEKPRNANICNKLNKQYIESNDIPVWNFLQKIKPICKIEHEEESWDSGCPMCFAQRFLMYFHTEYPKKVLRGLKDYARPFILRNPYLKEYIADMNWLIKLVVSCPF